MNHIVFGVMLRNFIINLGIRQETRDIRAILLRGGNTLTHVMKSDHIVRHRDNLVRHTESKVPPGRRRTRPQARNLPLSTF